MPKFAIARRKGLRPLFAFAMLVPMLALGDGLAAGQPVSSPHSHVGVAVKLTTLGVAIEGATPVSERVNVRAGVNFFSWSHDFDSDGITLTATLKLRSFNTYVDWFPFGGGFHVSPGAMLYNGNEASAVAVVPPNRIFTLGNDSLISNPANPVTGSASVSFASVAPSVLIGWGNLIPRSSRRWSIPFELGIVYSRAPTASLGLVGSACNLLGRNCRNIETDSVLKTDLATQQNKINNDLSSLKVLPVISVGFSYKF